MSSVKEIAERKHALLDRYRTALLDEKLEEFRAEAALEAENDRFAWKGEFRHRDEIMALYKERKRWDRRFLLDTGAITLVLFTVVFFSTQLVSFVAPRSSWKRDQDAIRQGNPLPAPSSADTTILHDENGDGDGAGAGLSENTDTNVDVDPVD